MSEHGTVDRLREVAAQAVARSCSVRNGVVAASCLPDPDEALAEIDAVTRQGLQRAAASLMRIREIVGEATVPFDGDDGNWPLPDVLSALRDEVCWLRSLLTLVAGHQAEAVSAQARQDAVELLSRALRQVT